MYDSDPTFYNAFILIMAWAWIVALAWLIYEELKDEREEDEEDKKS